MKLLKSIMNHLENHWKQVHEDLARDVLKSWQFHFCGHRIRIDNFLDEEKIYVNGQLVDHSKRKHALERFIPLQKLQARIYSNHGEAIDLEVTLGGFFAVNCTVRANQEIVFKGKHNVSLF